MLFIRHILVKSPSFQVGRFCCAPSYPSFHDTGPASGYLLVFPRTSVGIAQEGRYPVIADSTLVMFYNQGQEYRRELVSEEGDRCEFFWFPGEVVRNAIRPFDPGVMNRNGELFLRSHCVGSPQIYLYQRRIVERLLVCPDSDPLALEEHGLTLLAMAMEHLYQQSIPLHMLEAQRERRSALELTDAVKRLLADSYDRPLTLQAISEQVYCSPFHLCRIFRAVVGMPIHRYLNHLRLHAALEQISRRSGNLSGLALDLGFSSHSHFTRLFKQEFGLTPSVWGNCARI